MKKGRGSFLKGTYSTNFIHFTRDPTVLRSGNNIHERASFLLRYQPFYFEPTARFSCWNALLYSLRSLSQPNGDTTLRHGCKHVWLIAGRECSTLMYTNTGSVCWINRGKVRVCVCVSLNTIQIHHACVCVSVVMPVWLADGQLGPFGCQTDGSLTVCLCVCLSFKYLLFVVEGHRGHLNINKVLIQHVW